MSEFTKLEGEIEAVVTQAMQTWNVPGLALAVVKDDRVVIAKGFGVRETGKPEQVDEHTLFAIGSNTKAFTAAAIGLLVQEGRLAWDDPVTKHLPHFRLYDPHATQLISVRDLLCHRSGLGTWAGDMLLMSKYPVEEIVRRIRYIPPEFSFRAGFGYSNLMFITAGLVISTISGLSWDDFIQQRLFEPLGLADSVTHPCCFGERSNIATPHEDIQGRLQAVAHRSDERAGAAGSIYASAADIARWLQFQLNQGRLDGQPLIDPALMAEMHTPHTLIRMSDADRRLFPGRHFIAYGLGWFLDDDDGRLTVRHTGGVAGMLSSTLMLPEERLGIAIFTNKLPNAAYMALTYALRQIFSAAAPAAKSHDWLQRYTEQRQEEQQKVQQARQKLVDARAQGTRPSLPLERYAGEYESQILGGASLRLVEGRLRLETQVHETIAGWLEHWHYDTFQCRWEDPTLGDSLVRFIGDGQGQAAEFRVKIREDWIDPVEHVYVKRAAG